MGFCDPADECCAACATHILPSTFIELTELKFVSLLTVLFLHIHFWFWQENKALTLDLLKGWSGLEVNANATDVRNAIFVNVDDASRFQRFAWYFESVVRDFDADPRRYQFFHQDHEPNTYVLESPSRKFKQKQKKVTFADSSGLNIPLPDARYLALHASFARTFARSGVVRYYARMAARKAQRLLDETSSEEEAEIREGSEQNMVRKKNVKKSRRRR